MLDLVIIGASAAGCSAAVYAARRNLNFRIVTKDSGGEVALSGVINNWPGQIETNGFKLAQDFINQIKSYNVPVDEGLMAKSIRPEKNYYIITAADSSGKEKQYETKTVIIASGIHPRVLNLKGEKELRGKGITYCTVCDGPLFKGKTTATIGSGNSALESALMMAGIAKKVYLITRYADNPENNCGFPKGENILVDKVKALDNIEIIYNAESKAVLGSSKVESLKYFDLKNKQEKEIKIDGAMIHIGMVPNSDFADVEKNKIGDIKIDNKCRTSQAGIFAAGDVTDVPYKQIAIAAGQGVISALSAIEYINKWKEK